MKKLGEKYPVMERWENKNYYWVQFVFHFNFSLPIYQKIISPLQGGYSAKFNPLIKIIYFYDQHSSQRAWIYVHEVFNCLILG